MKMNSLDIATNKKNGQDASFNFLDSLINFFVSRIRYLNFITRSIFSTDLNVIFLSIGYVLSEFL
jgi:hypothetical protein